MITLGTTCKIEKCLKRVCVDYGKMFTIYSFRSTLGGNNEDVNFGGGFVLILQQNDDEEFNENRLETMEEFLEKIRLFGYIRKILNIYDVREVCRCGAPPVKGERPNDMASKVSLVKRSYPLLTAQAEQDEGKPPHGYNFLPSNAPWNKNFMTNLRLDGRELSENKQKIWAGYVRNLLKKHSELKPQLKDASNNHTEQHLQPPPTSEEDDGVQRAAEDVKPAVARRSDNALGDDDAALSLDPTFQFSWLKHNPLEAEGMRYKKKNPFDKEGIRFKRSVFLFHQYPFGREGRCNFLCPFHPFPGARFPCPVCNVPPRMHPTTRTLNAHTHTHTQTSRVHTPCPCQSVPSPTPCPSLCCLCCTLAL